MLWCCCGQGGGGPTLFMTMVGDYSPNGFLGNDISWPTPTLARLGRDAIALFYHGLYLSSGVVAQQGATLANATLNLRGTVDFGFAVGQLVGEVRAYDIDDAPATNPGLTDYQDIVDLPKTTAAEPVTINCPAPGAPVTASINVTAIVNEIIARAGWTSGNAILFLLHLTTESTDNVHVTTVTVPFDPTQGTHLVLSA